MEDSINRKVVKTYIGNVFTEVPIRNTSVAEHDESIEVMASHLEEQDNGKVGIFWYDRRDKVLFGVVAVDKNSFSKPNTDDGLITCFELHYKIWQKGFNKQKYKLNGVGPFIGDYKDTPRGRVFYNPRTDTYEIKVGDWIDNNLEAIPEIIEEFDLEGCKFEVIKDYH